MALPEPHAIYTAHLAYGLGLHYWHVPLTQHALHSAPSFTAPVALVGRALRRAIAARAHSVDPVDVGECAADDGESAGDGRSAGEAAAAGSANTGGQGAVGATRTDEDRTSRVRGSEDEATRLASPAPGTGSVEVVVARYREDFAWCARYNCTVYNKGPPVPPVERAAVPRWRSLPNVGRESHTWLWHVEHWYDALADRTVFLQGEPWDHLAPGLALDDYVNTTGVDTFVPLTAVARNDLQGLAFRDGYAPFAPFTGRLEDPVRWAALNRRRLPALLQPLGLWGATLGYNKSEVEVDVGDDGAALPNMLRLPLHWIDRRMHEQRARTLVDFWRAFMRCEPPTHLFHAQGAQFSVSRRAIQSRPRAFYRTLLDELLHVDPVASYYLEVMWWYIFDARAARACVPLE